MNAKRAVLTAIALCATASSASAQVGHAPGNSPFRDIYKGHAVSAMFGHVGGNGGLFGIGPHSGNSYGLRYDLRAGSSVQLGLGFYRANLERLIVNPFVVLVNRVSGPVNQTVSFAEANLQLNLTGGKTWHRLAPFLGASVGVTFPSGTAADTSGFEFGHKIYLAPTAGTRIFITSRLHIRAEARAMFWKIKYPVQFTLEPPDQPGTAEHPNAVISDNRTSEWTATPWLQVGLGYSFSP